MANGLSFGTAREHVLAELGGEAVGDESRLELIMQAALVEVAKKLAINRDQRVTIAFTLEADTPTYTLPGDCSRVVEIRVEGRVIPQRPPLRDLEAITALDVNNWPAFWWVNIDPVAELVFEPPPDDDIVAYVEYVSTVDIDLYDLVNGERVWRTIPLPVEVHPAFIQYCLGRAMVKMDPGTGAMIANAALTEILSWRMEDAKSRKPRLVLNSQVSRHSRTMDRWENDAAQFRPNYT